MHSRRTMLSEETVLSRRNEIWMNYKACKCLTQVWRQVSQPQYLVADNYSAVGYLILYLC